MSESVVQPRIVPGAPAPAPLSKNQKKRRKAKKPEGPDSPTVEIPDSATAALIEKAPETADIQEGAVATELIAQPEEETALLDVALKPSPIVELINKRLKAATKKIGRIATYAATEPEKLNEDQRATLKTLPVLEAVQKELGEVKKTVEVHEAELVHELAAQKIEAVKAERAKVDVAVTEAKNLFVGRTTDIFTFLRFRSLLASGEVQTPQIGQNELHAVFTAADVLLGENADTRQSVLSGFLYQNGEFEGVTYTRLVEISDQALNPLRAPTPLATSSDQESNLADSQLTTVDSEADHDGVGGIPAMTPSGSFHFMQASEIEPSFEDNVEWVERQDAIDPDDQPEEAIATSALNGHAVPPEESSASIDWAADDDEGLPSLPSLQAKFGSGTATPVTPAGETAEDEAPVNGYDNEVSTPVEEDGFTTHTRGRGRGRPGRGRGGFRGGDRGGRGRGDFRGRGRGGDNFRGRGGRGGYRGGERGGGV